MEAELGLVLTLPTLNPKRLHVSVFGGSLVGVRPPKGISESRNTVAQVVGSIASSVVPRSRLVAGRSAWIRLDAE